MLQARAYCLDSCIVIITSLNAKYINIEYLYIKLIWFRFFWEFPFTAVTTSFYNFIYQKQMVRQKRELRQHVYRVTSGRPARAMAVHDANRILINGNLYRNHYPEWRFQRNCFLYFCYIFLQGRKLSSNVRGTRDSLAVNLAGRTMPRHSDVSNNNPKARL